MKTDHEIIVRATEAEEWISQLENELETIHEQAREKKAELAGAIAHLRAIFRADENDAKRPLFNEPAKQENHHDNGPLSDNDEYDDGDSKVVSYKSTNPLDSLVIRKASRK